MAESARKAALLGGFRAEVEMFVQLPVLGSQFSVLRVEK